MDSINELYDEKKANAPIPKEKIKLPKKIKKKDMVIEPIETRELQYYEFNIINGIPIYNGVLKSNKKEVLDNTEFYKIISPHNIFTELNPSTLTARGEFSNVLFNEELLIKTLGVPSIEYCHILKIGSNFGEVYNFPNPFINHSIYSMVNSINVSQGENIKIGCSCAPLMDISGILKLSESIDEDSGDFFIIYKRSIKEKINTIKAADKKRATAILKSFSNIQIFKILSEDEIKEIFDTLKHFIIDEIELKFCIEYINKIIKVIDLFVDYRDKCTCADEYYNTNNLNLDKDALIKKVKNSAAGRKPVEKKKSKRKVQGTGQYFSSQMTFEMYNAINNKITKIKVFRNGNYQIPGVKLPDMTDITDSVNLLQKYFDNLHLTAEKVEIPYIISVMRNYTCRLIDLNNIIILNKLEDILYFEKQMEPHRTSFANYIQFIKRLNVSETTVHKIFKYCNMSFYHIS